MARKTGSSGEKTARDLRSAALRLIAKHGYAAVSMRQIAEAVGVQAGALYLYTPDKQSLLADLMEDHMRELLQAWGVALAASAVTPRAQLESFVRFHIRYHLSRVDEVFIAYMELRNLNPDNFTLIESLRRGYEDELERILADGEVAGEFSVPDRRIATLALIALLTGVNTWYRDGGRLSVARIEEIYLHMVKGLVGWR